MNTEPSKVEILEAEVRHLENQRNGFSQAGLEVLSTLNRVEKERDALKRQVETLTSQLAEARKDSARLEWLFAGIDGIDPAKHIRARLFAIGANYETGMEIRPSIDAAMQPLPPAPSTE